MPSEHFGGAETMPSSTAQHDGSATQDQLFDDNLNLSILGLGVEYPPHRHGPESLDVLANRFYKDSPAWDP